MPEIYIIVLVLVSAMVGCVLVIKGFTSKGSKVSEGRLLRFATNSATEVLQTNWDKDDYYARLYAYASNDLGEHMRKNRNLLTRVLEERASLLGEFVSIENFKMGGTGFSLFPSQTSEIVGTLRCTKATVPVTILVNTSTETLSLDGIKINKNAAIPLSPDKSES